MGSRQFHLVVTISLAVNIRLWRNQRLQPKIAFSRFSPVHPADLEGQLRVDYPVDTPSGNGRYLRTADIASRGG
jgi:hypothetical protein